MPRPDSGRPSSLSHMPSNVPHVAEDLTRCMCLCATRHPSRRGICDYRREVVLVEMQPNPWARAVPMCWPCRQAANVEVEQ